MVLYTYVLFHLANRLRVVLVEIQGQEGLPCHLHNTLKILDFGLLCLLFFPQPSGLLSTCNMFSCMGKGGELLQSEVEAFDGQY